jgi:lipoprotein NlpI
LRAEADWEACETSPYPLQQIEACSAVIEDANADQSRRVTALINRGAQRANMGQHARAIADFGRALRLSPNNAHVYLERGLVHQNRGAYDAALRAFDTALAIDPTMRMALERRQAVISDRAQASRDEIAEISQQLARDPRNAELLNARCWLRAIHDDDLNLALADCDAALAASPQFAAALDSRGLVQLKRGALEASLADYEAALKIEPGRGHFLYGRGLARLGLGLRTEGEADLTAAEAAEPGVAALYRSYGVAP